MFIFDWDAHHGDGTNDIFRATNAVLFASIHQSGAFPGTGQITDAGALGGEDYSINLPVQKGSYEDAWFSMLGGYALDALGASVCATMEALAGDQPPDSVAPDFFTCRAASRIGFHWRL